MNDEKAGELRNLADRMDVLAIFLIIFEVMTAIGIFIVFILFVYLIYHCFKSRSSNDEMQAANTEASETSG